MEVSGLTYAAHDSLILDNLSAQFPDGQITALIGPNGAGKTTMLRCLSGELRARSGVVRFGNSEVDLQSDAWKFTTGVVPDSDALFEELTVSEQLRLAATLFGIRGGEQDVRVRSLIELSGLSDRHDALGGELSAGMRKRLAVAIALVHAPRILLFDEPLNTMDYTSSETFFELLGFLRSTGRTVLISGHSLHALVRVADRIVELRQGTVVNSIDLPQSGRSADEIIPLLMTAADQGSNAAGLTADLGWMQQ